MKALFSHERLTRLLVSFLLCAGVLWPVLPALGVEGAMVYATLLALGVLAVLLALSAGKRARLIGLAALGAACIAQFFLPGAGLFGGSYEAVKAIALYFNGVTSATALFSVQVACTLAVLAAVLGFCFSARGVGFVPATALVVLVLFGLWSLGKQTFIWYAAPGLVALLLLVAQTSHERSDLFQVLPMAAALVALGLLLVPSGQVVIQPLNKAAMDLKQTISDYLFFTEPRNVFTLGTYGYYPMGNSRLGGAAEPSDYPVMTVKTDRKTLLRGVVKDEYTGRSWRDTSSGRRYLYVNPRWASLRRSVFLENMPPEAVLQAGTMLDQQAVSVQVQNNIASTVFAPVFLRSVTTLNNMVPYFNDASELFITRDLASGDRYTVFAPVIEGGDSALGALVNAAASQKDEYYQTVQSEYLKLPDHLEQRVYDDMRNIIASAATPYDQACAILRHLQRYYRYSLSPQTPPENQDFVTYFMYVGKEGYCTYFASAMTVLCRMAGLPARYVEGFLAQPDGSGFAYVTGRNAHAWTEVYFQGFGWVPFDPTPAQQNLDQQQNDPQSEPSPSPSPSPSPEPPQDEQQDDQPTPSPENPEESQQPQEDDPLPESPPDDPPPFPWWLLLVLAALGGLGTMIFLHMPDRIAARQKTVQDRIFVYGSATYMVMKLLGRVPGGGETPLLFARRMDKQRALPAPILPLWRALALSNYSRLQPGEQQALKARETFHAIYKPQSLLVKLRFMLRAAFDRRCYRCLETALVHETPASLYGSVTSGTEGKGKPGKGGKAGKAAKTAATAKAGKNANTARAGKTSRAAKPGRAAATAKSAKAGKPARPGKAVQRPAPRPPQKRER